MMESRTWQRILRNVLQQVFCNNGSTTFPKSFTAFVQVFSDLIVFSLKCSALVAHPVHDVLLNFSYAYKWWLVQSGQSLMAFLPFECATKQQGERNELAEIKKSLYVYFLPAVVAVCDWISEISSTDGRELNIKALHKSISIILSEIEEICFEGLLEELNGAYVSTVSQFWHHSAMVFQKRKT